jgi:hypothetical protein
MFSDILTFNCPERLSLIVHRVRLNSWAESVPKLLDECFCVAIEQPSTLSLERQQSL